MSSTNGLKRKPTTIIDDDEVQFEKEVKSQSSESIMRQKSTKIAFIPHHNALTETEQFFSKTSHALAEFIDNSIQATNEARNRKIDISFFLSDPADYSKETKENYCIISDFGCGMTPDKIKEFATYALNQKVKVF